MTINARFGAVFAASLVLCGLALASSARAETDSCSLLTPAQVGAAVGAQVSGGQHVTATSLKTCTWTPTGSSELTAELLALDLVDELRLMIDPVFLGGGKRFFRDDGVCRRLGLVTSETTPTGAILATYARRIADDSDGPSGAPLPRPPRSRER